MIKITIEITDTPLPDGTFYGRIEATPENTEPVSKHERQMRDWIMDTLMLKAKEFVQKEGITKSMIKIVPVERKKNVDRTDRAR